MQKQLEMKVKREELLELERGLDKLHTQHLIKNEEVNKLKQDIETSIANRDLATKLLNGLSGEKQKWIYLNRLITKKIAVYQSDILLATAYVVYLAPFP